MIALVALTVAVPAVSVGSAADRLVSAWFVRTEGARARAAMPDGPSLEANLIRRVDAEQASREAFPATSPSASTDDVAKTGQKQRYGSQLRCNNGRYEPLPVEDETQLDQRRTALGMPPIAAYLASFRTGRAGC